MLFELSLEISHTGVRAIHIVKDINPHLVYTLSEHKSSTVAEFGIALL